ncbi:Subtilisin E [Thalassocella blandensis]|nr:Subtilisin E [Thalassocella blandensis]
MNELLLSKEIYTGAIVRLFYWSLCFLMFSLYSQDAFSNEHYRDEQYRSERKLNEQYKKLKAHFIQSKKDGLAIYPEPGKSNHIPELTVRVLLGSEYAEMKHAGIKSHHPSGENWQRLKSLVRHHGVELHHIFERQRFMAASLTETQLDRLMASGDIHYLMEDEVSFLNLDQSIAFISADAVQVAGFAGQDYAVAILDTGVDNTHEFFNGRIVEQACFSSGDGVQSFSLCPNGDTRQFGPGAADDCTDRFSSGDCRHGTHVAGIAAGSGHAFSGVVPNADIVAVQVFTYFPSSSRLGAFMSDQVAALEWLLNDAVTPNIAAINMSLGGGQHSVYCDDYPQAAVINQLREKGIATVIASGNDGFNGAVNAPGCISSALTVGSTVKFDNIISSFSNSAELVDMLAPGSSIYSSLPGNLYGWMSGTSMAAPHVTGAVAMLKSAVPAASIDAIEQALKTSGTPILDLAANVSMPRINVLSAYEQLLAVQPEPSVTPVPTPTHSPAPSVPAPGPCHLLPGDIPESSGALAIQHSKSWGIYANEGGLYRFYIHSAATSGSQEIRVSLAGYEVDISIAAGLTSIVDFPNVPAGTSTLTLQANTSDVVIGNITSELIWANGTTAPPGCDHFVYAVPGAISTGVGELAIQETRHWTMHLDHGSNLRIALVSSSEINSREVELRFNNTAIRISMDPGYETHIDFAQMAAGEYTLSLTAINEHVDLGALQVVAY